MNKYYLFSYGTLMNNEVQKILFGHELKMEDATLKDWKTYSDIDGYYYVKEKRGSSVKGKVLELTEKELWIADQWEEVPISLYLRKEVSAKLSSGEVKSVLIYLKTNVKAAIEVSENSVSSIDISEVLASARKFKNQGLCY